MEDNHNGIGRREFLKRIGLGTAVVAGLPLISCNGRSSSSASLVSTGEPLAGALETRVNPKTGEHVSLLGYGCMRWHKVTSGSDKSKPDQEQINHLVDYAIEHGVNYFDTSPAYCAGLSEKITGIALSRHPREKYFIATKISNFDASTWPLEEGIRMFRQSLVDLKTDYIDYLLLHSIGMTHRDAEGRTLSSMDSFNARFIDNGLLDFLLEERRQGRIRNLGFSYHGDVAVFDHMMDLHDQYHWDFAQIQLNYVDWLNAKAINQRNTNAEYLYGELARRDIPVVVMEPLLGGRLATMPSYAVARMKQEQPEASVASWAFRYAGSLPHVLTVLSGMAYMEHLQDNLRTYSPLKPCSEGEREMLHKIAEIFVDKAYVPCTACQYCMPCPYGIDIPSIFTHFNKMMSEGNYHLDEMDPAYRRARRAFLIGYDRSVPALRQANHCIGCNQCSMHCPQRIAIPDELHRIDRYVEDLKQGRNTF